MRVSLSMMVVNIVFNRIRGAGRPLVLTLAYDGFGLGRGRKSADCSFEIPK
jgi:hypothetical protein